MNVKFLDTFEMVRERAWDALAAKAPTRTVFQTWAWQRVWWRAHASAGRELRLVAVYEGDELRVVMPLFLEGRVLRPVGHGDADRIDLLYDAERSADLLALLGPLKARHDWDEIELGPLPDTSPTWRYLKIMAEEASLFPLTTAKYPLWGLDLEGREDRIVRCLETGLLAKHARIFAARGKVSATHERSPAAATCPWEQFFIQHIHRWASRAHPSLFTAREGRDLFRYIVEDPTLRLGAVLSVLRLNDGPAGYAFSLVHEKVLYACVSAFDMGLKRFSPDDALWRETVAYALSQECRAIVFVSPEEPVVRRFAERTGTARAVRVFRYRGRQWQAKVARWAMRLPMAAGVRALGAAFAAAVAALFTARTMVQQMRQATRAGGALQGDRPVSRPETELLRRLRPELQDIRMLDIGIGRGLTTVHFAPAVRSYHGFDHDQSVVTDARQALGDLVGPDRIFIADVRSMDFAGDGSYDLILFSGEGIDVFSPEDRSRVLKEVHRAGREGAWFCFSSRNLQSLRPWAGFGAADLLRRWRRRMLLTAANQDLERFRHQPSAMLFDEASGYRQAVHYVTPKEQVRVLKELGFHDVRVLSTRSGLEVRDWRRWDKLVDDSLYYLCRA